ncbi:hypothetical protein [Parahaliea mediterranea]|uniref:hypothetical protein n=1 Tax=Parahaliea mediterranea TaxID=651086 RepID=UPI0019D47CB8|nr:hypothetical protein [Parahaliea mediterranea]
MSMIVVVGLAAGSASALADRGDRENLVACNGSIEQALGKDVRTRLYGIQHRRDGDRLRLKVFPAEGQSQTLSCWVDDEGGVALQTADGVALRSEPASNTQRVSLSD